MSEREKEIYINLYDPRGHGNGSSDKGRSLRNAIRGKRWQQEDLIPEVMDEADIQADKEFKIEVAKMIQASSEKAE